MKRKICVCAALVAAPMWQTPAVAGEYCNGTFEYCIEYPDDFVPQPERDAHDGRIFTHAASNAEIRVWASSLPAALDMTTEKYFRQAQKEQRRKHKPDYELLKADRYVYSLRDGDFIEYVYDKAFKGNDGMFYALRFRYPASEQARMAPIIERTTRSLRPIE